MASNNHPILFLGLHPVEFSKLFNSWPYSLKKDFFVELNKEYIFQSVGDKKRGREQLASSLENLATSLYLTSKFMNDITFVESPTAHLVKDFGFTNYFYQKEVFNLMQDMPQVFDTVLKSVDKVCVVCSNHIIKPNYC